MQYASIDIWPACSSRLTKRETNHNIIQCTSVLAGSYLARRWPANYLHICPFAQHQWFAVCCPVSIAYWCGNQPKIQINRKTTSLSNMQFQNVFKRSIWTFFTQKFKSITFFMFAELCNFVADKKKKKIMITTATYVWSKRLKGKTSFQCDIPIQICNSRCQVITGKILWLKNWS